MKKERAPRNRTIVVSDEERDVYNERVIDQNSSLALKDIINRTLCADLFQVIDSLPPACVDLLVIDPPYNLAKNFHGVKFSRSDDQSYLEYLRGWFPELLKVLKPEGSVYMCGDWQSSCCLYQVMCENVVVRNRISWQREKGRGAKANWKNSTEDIWFGTVGDTYYFNAEAVKQKRRVLAPYRENGKPKDWNETEDGNFRLTCAGNFWDDISIPYWSMPENTDHPTQKPEKLIAKLVLASCPAGGLVLDPFLGSGTTSVVAKKLNRNYIGIEMNREYCIWAEKRLAFAEKDTRIQGYAGGFFWERNTLNSQLAAEKKGEIHNVQ